MPKAPATPESIEATRKRILNEALEIINKDGYASLSMRKLGSRLGVAAKTIYNYYSNKDELYLMVLIQGFQELTETIEEAVGQNDDPLAKLRAMARTYVYWGINHQHYYNIMFNMDTPKYVDYVGTPMEEIADHQNRTALQLIKIGSHILNELPHQKIDEGQIPFRLLKIWTSLHGIVSLHISRVTLSVQDISQLIDPMIDEILKDL